MEYVLIKKEDAEQLLSYVMSRPYSEAANLVTLLQNSQLVTATPPPAQEVPEQPSPTLEAEVLPPEPNFSGIKALDGVVNGQAQTQG